MSGAVSSHCHGHIDNLQLLDREATLLGTGKCPLYNYDSGMNRAARIQAATSITSLEGRLVSKQSSFVFAVSHLSYWALIMDTRVVNGPSQTFTVPREVEALVGTFSERGEGST